MLRRWFERQWLATQRCALDVTRVGGIKTNREVEVALLMFCISVLHLEALSAIFSLISLISSF